MLDGQRIIIFGGTSRDPIQPQDSLYVLDLSSFEWYIPKVSGKIPSPRINHRANVVENYMVVSFGE